MPTKPRKMGTTSSTEVKTEKDVAPVKAVKKQRKFMPGDMIECRCVRPNKVIFYSSKTDTRYEFGGYGDINEVDYSDLLKLKASRSAVLYQPKILIEDEELREQWARDLESVRAEYEGIYETDDIFNKDEADFENYLRNASPAIKDLVRIAAVRLLNEGKLTDLRKIRTIDDVLGTKLKEFV